MKQHSITALQGMRYCFFMTHDLPVPSSVPVGRYRNFKGDGHKVIGVVRHSESRKPMVLYRALYGEAGLWVQPFAMFVESVEVNGECRPQFAFISGSA